MYAHDAVHVEKVNGLTIRIKHDYDNSAESPVAEDEAVIFAVLHRRYLNPAKKRTEGDFNSVDGIEAFIKRNKGPRAKWVVFPLYMYDHGRTVYRCAETVSNPFIGRLPQGHAEFDSGRVGIIALKRSEWGKSKSMYEYAQQVCQTYTQWANGDVYGYVIEDADGEEVNSCWGFIGMESALDDARTFAKQVPATTEAK
jgi:hypothetical protein